MLPNRIFFTGAPGSRWSGIAQVLEQLDGINTSDHTPEREYKHAEFSGHKGAYFGPGMEFEPKLNAQYIDSAWADPSGCKIVKSHEWSEMIPEIRTEFPGDWILCIYRDTYKSHDWWKEAGGYTITYPNYSQYLNMLDIIKRQNKHIIDWTYRNGCMLKEFTPDWMEQNFGQRIEFDPSNWKGVFVSLWKPGG